MNPLHIIPIGEVDPSVIGWIATCVAREFGLWTIALDPIVAQPEAYQYSAVEMMRLLARIAPAGSFGVLGVTGRDLLGQARRKGRIALVSLARLRPEFYGQPADSLVFRARVRTEVMHKLGQSFGLVACARGSCPMSPSTSVAEVDAKSGGCCDSCQAQLDNYLERHRK